MRILEGWTDEERKELERASNGGYKDAFSVIRGILSEDSELFYIGLEYDDETHLDNDQLVKDIADYYAGVAKFAEPKKYYVKMPKVNYPYLIRDMGGKFDYAKSPDVLGSRENRFTAQEIKAIDPRYMAFAVPVEVDDE